MTFPILPSNSASTGYNLTRSLRFRSSASANLNRTYSGTGTSATIKTIEFGCKRGSLGSIQRMVNSTSSSATTTYIQFNADDTLSFNFEGSSTTLLTTSQVFRDPSNYYFIIVAIDTTQTTAANRVKIYVNGSQITAFSAANYPAQNATTTLFGQVSANNRIGSIYDGTGNYFDGYFVEFVHVDGQALTPSSFGSFSSTTGVWQPAKYTGSYGTNGFYLPFTDNSALTTSSNVGLGKDFSGNGNYWTTNNISITAGSTYDSMTDVPTLTSATAANFATWNPLQPHDSGITVTHADGNLSVSSTYSSGPNMVTIPSTIKTSPSGKWYWEITAVTNTNGGNSGFGVITADSYVEGSSPPTNNYLYIGTTGNKSNNGSLVAYGATYGVGDIVGVALDVGAGTLTFYKNGVSQGVAFTGLPAVSYLAAATNNGTGTRTYAANFGQQPFTYTPPSGFVALNTYNLPSSTILQGNKVMDATLYTGTLLSNSVTNAASFKPDLVWVKSRSAATDHKLTDSVRGVTKGLVSDSTAAETTDVQGLTAFNSNGFTVGTDTNYNNLSATYVAWQWQAGAGSSGSNTNGTITSTVSVNASAGFSVVTYTGNGSAGATVGHGLGVAPAFIIIKDRPGSSNWIVMGSFLGANKYLILQATNAVGTGSPGYDNGTLATSSVFSISSSTDVNGSGTTYVAYCWAAIPGFSAFGSYTGNGSTSGPFVYTGFLPKWVMFKRTDATSSWYILDTSRNNYNVVGNYLLPNTNSSEGSTSLINILSNGFSLATTATDLNASGGNYVYAAFASNPFKNSLAF